MSQTLKIEYFYSLMSPWTYFGQTRLWEICQRHKVKLVYKPVKFADVYPVSGATPVEDRAQQRVLYRELEIRRWGELLGMPVNPNPKYFPSSPGLAMLMSCAILDLGGDPGMFGFEVLASFWAREEEISDKDNLIAIANKTNGNGTAIWEASQTDQIKAQLAANTREAIDRNIFGPPSYVFNDELFYGQDRLALLDQRIMQVKLGMVTEPLGNSPYKSR